MFCKVSISVGGGNSLKKFTAPSKYKGVTIPPPPTLEFIISRDLKKSLNCRIS